jgi:MFS transporter, ACS family, glucarate transporter
MRKRHAVLTMLFLLSVITYLDRVCISVAGPRMQADLNISPERWGWVVGAFTISYAAFEIPSGALGDRIGPRAVLTRIVVWWSAFTSITGAVSNFFVLLIVRFMFGAGEAGAYPNISGAISRWFPATERGRAHGVTWMASRIGGAISPLLVVPIQAAYGWRAAFWVFGILGIIWAVFWYRWYKDHPRDMPGITQKELDEIGAGKPHSHAGVPWRRIFGNSNLWTIMAMYHTYCWGSYFYLSWLHTYLQKGRGLTESEMGYMSTLPFILGAIANNVGGFLSDHLSKRFGLKWGRRSVGFAGLFLSAVFLLGTGLTSGKLIGVVFLSLGYASMDCMLPVSWAVCLDVGRRHAGAVTGAMNTAGQVGSFLSSVLFGYIVQGMLERGYSDLEAYNTPLIFFSAMLAISAFLFLRIDPTRQLDPEPESEPLAPATPQGAAHV